MSSTHIAGAAAFLWSLNTDWDRTQIENHLKNTAAPVSLVADQTLGGGRLDLLAAVFRDGMTYHSNDTNEANRTGEVTSDLTTFGWTTGTMDPADPVGTAQSSRDFLVAQKEGDCMAPVILDAGSDYTVSTSLPAHSGDIEMNSGLEEDDRLLIRSLGPDQRNKLI